MSQIGGFYLHKINPTLNNNPLFLVFPFYLFVFFEFLFVVQFGFSFVVYFCFRFFLVMFIFYFFFLISSSYFSFTITTVNDVLAQAVEFCAIKFHSLSLVFENSKLKLNPNNCLNFEFESRIVWLKNNERGREE